VGLRGAVPSALVGLAGLGAVAQWLPSVVSLGQWTPLRALPGGWCRWRGPAQPKVALTFDDGPSPLTTTAVLGALAHLGLVGTFFCVGRELRRWPGVADEIVQRGHVLGTHGYHHAHHLGQSPRWVYRDLDAALGALGDIGVRPRWFRPPYGQVSGPTMAAARRRGLELVLWSSWGREWAAPDAKTVARRVTAALGPGSIVVLHDGSSYAPAGTVARAIDALGPIADELDRLGLRSVSLDELVPARGSS